MSISVQFSENGMPEIDLFKVSDLRVDLITVPSNVYFEVTHADIKTQPDSKHVVNTVR